MTATPFSPKRLFFIAFAMLWALLFWLGVSGWQLTPGRVAAFVLIPAVLLLANVGLVSIARRIPVAALLAAGFIQCLGALGLVFTLGAGV